VIDGTGPASGTQQLTGGASEAMMRRSLGVIAAAGLLATALAGPVTAQGRIVEIPAGEPIVIATWGSLSGTESALGQDWLYAVEVAVNDREGELLGHPIELQSEDGECLVPGGAQAALNIVANPQVVGLIGSACSDETVGGIATITNAGLTTISPSATRPALTVPERAVDYAGFLRTAHSDAFQGRAVAEWAIEQGLGKVATIHDGSAYAEALVDVFRTEYQTLGGEVAAPQAVAKLQTDMSTVLTSIAAEAPDAIYLPIFSAEGGFIVDQVRDVAGLEETVLVGSDGLFSQDFIEAAGPNVEGMYLSSPDFSLFQDTYAGLVERYLEHSGLDNTLQTFHAHGFDAANILFTAIEEVAVQNEDGSLSIDLQLLRERIYATENFEGVTGLLTCGDYGDCGAPLIAMYQIGPETVNDDVWPPVKVWPE
jgi:branched-chain amino acid transport system substrate-binding protein